MLANAAAALFAAEAVKNLHDGVLMAEESLRSGKALGVLEELKVGEQ